jgi:uncharacterized membrane protein (UPF0136 family)
MGDRYVTQVAPAALVSGALLGMAGTFVQSDSTRGLLWGLDGTALIVATAILTIHHVRRGNDTVAAGFLVFVAAETLIVAGSAMNLEAVRPLFAAGAALWAASMTLVSAPKLMPSWLRAVSVVGSILFLVVAVQIFSGSPLTPLTKPLPFFAFPFLAATLIGWAWVHSRNIA